MADDQGVVYTPPGLKVALIGDQGVKKSSRRVLELIRDEGADLVIHSGDFDYKKSPLRWDRMISEILGEDYPYFASVGDHDLPAWNGYKEKLEDRIQRLDGVEWSGELGECSTVHYKGLTFALSAVDLLDYNHASYIESELSASDSIWRIASWHRNHEEMQTGKKTEPVGWDVYQAAMRGGGIITTGHEHAYSRTYTLSDFGNTERSHGKMNGPYVLEVGRDRTFVVVSGIAGKSRRRYRKRHLESDWWAAVSTRNRYVRDGKLQDARKCDYGALFITFHADNDPRKARGAFKTIKGETIDEFVVRSLNLRE